MTVALQLHVMGTYFSSNDPFNTSGFASILNCYSLSTIVIHSAFIFVVLYLPLVWANADFFFSNVLIVWMCHDWQFLFLFRDLNKLIQCVTFVFIVSWIESQINYDLVLLRRLCFHPCLFAGLNQIYWMDYNKTLTGGWEDVRWDQEEHSEVRIRCRFFFKSTLLCQHFLIVDWFSFIEVDCWALVEVRSLLSGILVYITLK